MRDVDFFYCLGSVVLLRYHSKNQTTSESSGVCQVQKLKHWDRSGRQRNHLMCLRVCSALSEEGI